MNMIEKLKNKVTALKEKLKAKVTALKEKAKDTARSIKAYGKRLASKALDWIADNPEKAIVIGGAIAGSCKKAIKAKRRYDKYRRFECRVYDRRTDTYSYSTRPLKAREKQELECRYCSGERKSDVLQSMGLLKY